MTERATMTEHWIWMTDEKAALLREPFPPSAIGKIPKGGVELDYVGHAATTDRLLKVDPTWTWEPLACDERGLPALDADGNLWIKLTVCGVTRLGVGDGKNAKELIGDALRNAAMRFGVALDLWSKQELHDAEDSPRGIDPARELLPGAIEVKTTEDATTIRRSLAEFDVQPWDDVEEFCALHVFGKRRADLSRQETAEFWRRLANAVVMVTELAGPGDFPPPTRAHIIEAFAWAFNGVVLALGGAEAAVETKSEQEDPEVQANAEKAAQ